MRALGDHRQRTASTRSGRWVVKTLGVLALSVGLLTSTGCARRLVLSPQEFEFIEKQKNAREDLRVYVSKKLVILYELEDEHKTYDVAGDVSTSATQNILRVIIGKNTQGKVLETENKNGAPLLWVTFNSKCRDKDCAFAFVQTDDGVFRLHSAPRRDRYKAPTAYFKSEKKQMKLGKLKSLAEKNDVFLWKNPRDKIFTIDLIIKKRNVTKKRVETERGTGVDYDEN
jgi:hypothetical protein